jgi:hypothetical protein
MLNNRELPSTVGTDENENSVSRFFIALYHLYKKKGIERMYWYFRKADSGCQE